MLEILGKERCEVEKNLKKYWKDIAALCILFGVVFVFYSPETNPLYSRYSYTSSYFERAAKYINPEYTIQFLQRTYEEYFPLQTLLARYYLIVFQNNFANVLAFFYISLALFAAALTYMANRYFFSVWQSLLVSLLLLVGRTLMPVVRQLGIIGVLFLIPFALIFIHNLAKTQDRTRPWKKQLIPTTLVAFSIAVMYCLGGHEVVFSMLFLFGFSFLLVLEYIVKCRREKQPWRKQILQCPTTFTKFSLAMGGVLILVIFALTIFGIHKEQKPVGFLDSITYKKFIGAVVSDAKAEPQLAEKNPFLIFRSTFIEGKYLTKWGSSNQRLFLYPSKGFNGIVPLFLLPGLLIGFFKLAKDFILLFQPNSDKYISRSARYFVLLNVTLLGLLLVTILLSGDPKPTRYTLSIYALLALSVQGYEIILQKIKGIINKLKIIDYKVPRIDRSVPASHIATALILILLAVVTTKRLFKNYRDLQINFRTYKLEQLPPLRQVFDVALSARFNLKPIYIFYRYAHISAVGMLFRFKIPENVTFVHKRNGYDQWKLHGKPIPPNSVAYIWDEETKSFNIQYGKEA